VEKVRRKGYTRATMPGPPHAAGTSTSGPVCLTRVAHIPVTAMAQFSVTLWLSSH